MREDNDIILAVLPNSQKRPAAAGDLGFEACVLCDLGNQVRDIEFVIYDDQAAYAIGRDRVIGLKGWVVFGGRGHDSVER